MEPRLQHNHNRSCSKQGKNRIFYSLQAQFTGSRIYNHQAT
uniref:Uncharacterized protein n=1 Tax=Rhizophora mucronata TaxID=61149 RepID=A0A2P2PN88_RHIMU